MNSTSIKFEKAIKAVENIDQLMWVIDKIKTTSQINRRTKEGRYQVSKLLAVAHQKHKELIANGELPF